jgi:hypothetical protein
VSLPVKVPPPWNTAFVSMFGIMFPSWSNVTLNPAFANAWPTAFTSR